MTLEQRLIAFAQDVGAKLKRTRTLVNGNLTDLGALKTTAKDNLVNAINEVFTSSANKQDSIGFTPENIANKGQPNGYASLDANAKVPASQLPGFVDDVLEFNAVADFPAAGEAGKLYVATSTDKTYRWSGTAYRVIVASPGTTDAVTEGQNNLYFTNARAQAALAPLLGNTDADLVAAFEAALL